MSDSLSGLEVLALKNQLRVSLESILLLGINLSQNALANSDSYLNFVESEYHLKLDHQPIKLDFFNVRNLVTELNSNAKFKTLKDEHASKIEKEIENA